MQPKIMYNSIKGVFLSGFCNKIVSNAKQF
ncbi:hypothetical protein X474_19945 [Dethiosulfatarculus sandiegensis]|uniref:Uncharacterized protein n=1 Tax=Dethiosulfatarculus sandiegensis TaxID=1429043 RepID=A0A0D2HP02_9BACT|nr:hypothetical protein X474_19945 [Dethiosulfatarculus sandiegensis]